MPLVFANYFSSNYQKKVFHNHEKKASFNEHWEILPLRPVQVLQDLTIAKKYSVIFHDCSWRRSKMLLNLKSSMTKLRR